MNPEDIYVDALNALTSGQYSAEEVDAVIAQSTRYGSLDELGTFLAPFQRIQDPERKRFAIQMAEESRDDAQTASEQMEIAEHPVRNFAGSMGQGATFGWLDEIVGLANEGAGESMREAHELRREHAPVATALGEIAGAAALPAIPGAAAGRARPGAVRGLLSGAARGMVSGGLGGGLMAAGLAAPGERAEAARTGAQWGAVGGAALGAPFGAAGGLLAARVGRGSRVADALTEAVELPQLNRMRARGNMDDALTVTQRVLYDPLDEMGIVTDPELLGAITTIADDVQLGRIVPNHLAERARSGQGLLFSEAQQIRSRLRQMANSTQDVDVARVVAAGEGERIVDNAMQSVFGESLARADDAWARLNNRVRAFKAGEDLASETNASKVQEALFELGSDAERQAFRQGMVSQVVSDLQQQRVGVVPRLRTMMNADIEPITIMRTYFPDGPAGDRTFRQFLDLLEREARDEKIVEFFNSSVKSAAIGVAGGAAAGGLMSVRGREGGN